MTQTIKAPRFASTTKTSSEVSSMLLDIATVLRLSAVVKAEMLRDRAEADRQTIETRRATRLAELAAMSV